MLGQCPGKLICRELQAGAAVQQADAEVRVALREQPALGALRGGQQLRRDARAGGDARGKAGIGGLVPGEQPGLVRQTANFRLRQAAFAQRRADVHLAQGAHTGAVPGVVRGIRAVEDEREPVLGCRALQISENILLAVIAAVRRIARHILGGQGIQLQHGQLCTDALGQPLRVVQLKLRLERRLGEVSVHVCAALHRSIQQI